MWQRVNEVPKIIDYPVLGWNGRKPVIVRYRDKAMCDGSRWYEDGYGYHEITHVMPLPGQPFELATQTSLQK